MATLKTTPRSLLLLTLLGAAAGVLAGMLGIGGGLLIGPALILLGYPLKKAFGTALAVVLAAAAVAVATELILEPQNFHWWPAVALVIGGQIGAKQAAGWLHRISEQQLRWAFLVLVLYASLRNLGVLGETPANALSGIADGMLAIELPLCVLLGILAGITAVFFGIGGGVVMVPGMVLLVGGFPIAEAMATSLLAMVPTAALSLRLAVLDQRVDAQVLPRLLPAAVIGAVVGVNLRNYQFAPAQLATMFGAFLLWVAFELIRRGRQVSPS